MCVTGGRARWATGALGALARGPAERPLAKERGAPGARAALDEQREILGAVDVQTEAGQGEDGRDEAALASRLEVVVERRLAEFERHDVGRGQQGGVGAEAREGRHE